MVCEGDVSDCPVNTSETLTGGASNLNVSDVGEVWHIINLSTSVVTFLFTITANASLIFALKKAKRQTFTATSIAWISKADAARILVVYISCIPSAIARGWIYGDTICWMTGYITTTITIGQSIIFLFMSIIRYLAIVKPCVSRETSLFRAGTVAVIFAVVTSVPAGALPFLATPSFDYNPVVHICVLQSSWASKATKVIFNVIPTFCTLVLASLTVWKIYVNKWSTRGVQSMGFKRRSGPAARPGFPEIRASKGIATVLTVSSLMVIFNVFIDELSVFSSTISQMICLCVSNVLFQAGPTVRSFLFIATSTVLRQVLVDSILSTNHPDTVVPSSSNFKMIQGKITAPKPVYSREHRVTIHVEPHSQNDDLSTVVSRFRRPSNVSTVTCEVLCDGEQEACTISICGDYADSEDKGGSGSTDSVLVCIGSTFNGKMNSSNCSLSGISTETILSSSLQHAGSYTRPKYRTSCAHKLSTVSLNSLSPLDVRYISQIDRTLDAKNKFPNASVSMKTTPIKKQQCVPIILREKNTEDESDIPAAKFAFYSDPEESQEKSQVIPGEVFQDESQISPGEASQDVSIAVPSQYYEHSLGI